MRVRSVHIEGHPGLGDLDAAFCGDSDPAPRVVVLAGQNGCGKTVLLGAIHQALSEENHSLAEGLVTLEVEVRGPAADALRRQYGDASDGVLRIRMRHDQASGTYSREYSTRQGVGSWRPMTMPILLAAEGPSLLATSVFSEASVSFDPRAIRHATGVLPEASPRPARSAGPERDLATETAQLFVDMRMADGEDLQRHHEVHGCAPQGWPAGSRVSVFAEAFARMFPGKRLLGVTSGGSMHQAVFEEHGRRSTLGQLSSGEKQVVFRGGFLLARRAALRGAVVLIDEPELSLHPDWQSGILAFYERILFGAEGAASHADAAEQLILATHSPFVVHGSPGARHVVLARGQNGRVSAKAHPTYPGVTGEVAIAAFDIGRFLADASGARRPTLLVEGPTDQTILAEAWKRLRPGLPMPFDVQSADGATCIGTLLRQPAYRAIFAEKRSAVCGLFDFDQRGYGEWNRLRDRGRTWTDAETDETLALALRHADAPAWAVLLPVPAHRVGYASKARPNFAALEMEHLFTDDKLDGFAEEVAWPGGSFLVVPEGKKAAFSAAVSSFKDADFAVFKPILDRLDAVTAEIALGSGATGA